MFEVDSHHSRLHSIVDDWRCGRTRLDFAVRLIVPLREGEGAFSALDRLGGIAT